MVAPAGSLLARSLGLERCCGSSLDGHCLLDCSSYKDDPLRLSPPHRRIQQTAPTVAGKQITTFTIDIKPASLRPYAE